MIVGNLENAEEIKKAVQGQDIVYNFACIADIKEASENPIDEAKTNVIGHINLLEGSAHSAVQRFIYASTLYVYSRSGSFYRTSKQAAELFIEGFHEEFGLPYTIIRYGTLYGPRAPEWNGFYQLLRKALETGKLEYQGSGEEVREFLHVYDAADCCINLLDDEYENLKIIVNGPHSIKGGDLVALVSEIFNGKLEVVYRYEESKRPGHYVRTPFAFKPELAKQLNMKSYISLGQGILDYLNELNPEVDK
jgi:UDP-glucose 4-epimerase